MFRSIGSSVSFNVVIFVDNWGMAYVDGEVVASSMSALRAERFSISPSSRCFAVHVNRLRSGMGLMVTISTNIVSDPTWKCTSKTQADLNWTKDNFNDSLWPNAVVKSRDQHIETITNFEFGYSGRSMPLWIGVENDIAAAMFCRYTLKRPSA